MIKDQLKNLKATLIKQQNLNKWGERVVAILKSYSPSRGDSSS